MIPREDIERIGNIILVQSDSITFGIGEEIMNKANQMLEKGEIITQIIPIGSSEYMYPGERDVPDLKEIKVSRVTQILLIVSSK